MRPDDLDRELSAAGDRARRLLGRGAVPDRGFADSLRTELLAGLPSQDPGPARRRAPWFALPRQLRLAPLALAAVLAVATGAFAGELYVAFVADRPEPTPTVAPSPEATPSVTQQPTSEPTSEPTPVPTEQPTPEPTATAVPTPEPTPEPTSRPTPVPAPDPTAKPTPKPDPTPQPIGDLSLSATGCNGGVVLAWSAYGGAGFHHYTTLRNTEANIPMAYPPQAGAVDFGGTYAPMVEKTSAVDASGTPGVTYYYRTMAFDADDGVLAASPVTGATAKPVKDLGGLGVTAESATDTRLTWTPYAGSPACFTYYKIVYSETNPEPSYGTDPYLAAIGSQETSTWVTSDLLSGQTYYLRVQAVRATQLGWFVAAQTDVATYTVP